MREVAHFTVAVGDLPRHAVGLDDVVGLLALRGDVLRRHDDDGDIPSRVMVGREVLDDLRGGVLLRGGQRDIRVTIRGHEFQGHGATVPGEGVRDSDATATASALDALAARIVVSEGERVAVSLRHGCGGGDDGTDERREAVVGQAENLPEQVAREVTGGVAVSVIRRDERTVTLAGEEHAAATIGLNEIDTHGSIPLPCGGYCGVAFFPPPFLCNPLALLVNLSG